MAQGRADKCRSRTENWRIVPAVFRACAAIDTPGGAAQIFDGQSVQEGKAGIYADNIRIIDGKSVYDVILDGKLLGEFRLTVPGRHNISNSNEKFSIFPRNNG